MRKWIALTIMGLAVWCPQVRAQHEQNLKPYRLFFVAATTGDNGKDVSPALLSYMRTAGVADEKERAAKVLQQFKRRYTALMNSYNESPSVKAGSDADVNLYLAERDLLVQSTIDMLQALLRKEHFDAFAKHVAKESVNIYGGPAIAAHIKHAQMKLVQNGMVPHYDAYRTSTFDGQTHIEVETVVVEGYTSCSYCPYWHTPSVYNGMNGGGWITGTQVTPPTQISLSNQRSVQFDAGCFDPTFPEVCNATFDEEAKVQCTGAGSIFHTLPPLHVKLEPYSTISKNISWDGAYTWQVTEWCYNPPPLVEVATVYWVGHTPPPDTIWGWQTDGLCISSTWLPSGWNCTHAFDLPVVQSYPLSYCTPWSQPPY